MKITKTDGQTLSFDLTQAIESAINWGGLFTGAPPRWTRKDDAFLRESLSFLSDEEIGKQLGRTAVAIKLRRQRDLRLPAHSKLPGYMTGRQAADALGVDIHNVMALVERGILPARRMAGAKGILMVRRITLLRWAVNPANWPYFRAWNVEAIPDEHIRRLVARQKARWGDEWLTPGQAAELRGVDHKDVNRLIHAGKIRALQWGNWWILRSEITRPDLVFYKGKGAAQVASAGWNDGVDAFIIRARNAGETWDDIAAKTGWDKKRLAYRGSLLIREGRLRPISRWQREK